jgi:hypothetical protein
MSASPNWLQFQQSRRWRGFLTGALMSASPNWLQFLPMATDLIAHLGKLLSLSFPANLGLCSDRWQGLVDKVHAIQHKADVILMSGFAPRLSDDEKSCLIAMQQSAELLRNTLNNRIQKNEAMPPMANNQFFASIKAKIPTLGVGANEELIIYSALISHMLPAIERFAVAGTIYDDAIKIAMNLSVTQADKHKAMNEQIQSLMLNYRAYLGVDLAQTGEATMGRLLLQCTDTPAKCVANKTYGIDSEAASSSKTGIAIGTTVVGVAALGLVTWLFLRGKKK